jgi:hypothetical protein
MKEIVFSVVLLALVCSAASWGQTTPSSGAAQTQQAKQDEPLRKPSAYSGSPIVGEFQRSQLEPVADSERRQAREKRYVESHFKRAPFVDPGLLVNGKQETPNITVIDYSIVGSPDPRGIPVSGSTATIVGTVTGGSSFITKDKTYVYTDYTVRVDQILALDKTASLSVGSEIVVAREGGAIHYPSGHITNVLIQGHGFPEVGGQYVLFLLKPIPNSPEYEMTLDSGYQIKNGRVYPLDDVNSQYVGMDLPVFLDEVNKAIAASRSKGVGQEEDFSSHSA